MSIVGHAGHELGDMFGLAMKLGTRGSELRDHISACPTFAPDIKHMLGRA